MIPEGGIYQKTKKGRPLVTPHKIHSSTPCHYANPSEGAPQQSFGPLHVTVNTKMKKINIFITLSFPQH